AWLVDHRGRERANPRHHAEEGVGRGRDVAHRAASARGVAANPAEARDVGAEGERVLVREVDVNARVELVAAARGGQRQLRELYIGDAVESAAVQAAEGKVLTLRAREAAYVEAAADLLAVRGVEARGRARDGDDGDDARLYAGRAEYLRGDASGPLRYDERAELRRLDEGVEGVRVVAAQSLVGEGEEGLVLPAPVDGAALAEVRQHDGAAKAPAKLTEPLVDAHGRRAVWAAVLVEGVQARTVVLEEEAPVESVRPVLRDCE